MADVVPSVEDVWRRYDADEVRLTAPLSARMIELARLTPGQRVLDLATGRGEPALAAAKRVAPGGRVVGVDPAETMLAMTRARAELEGVTNLELHTRRAEDLSGLDGAPFDAVLARWGLMYMDEPLRALCEARRVLRDGGHFVAAVWCDPERVDYFSLPRQILQKFAPVPEISEDIPGTFYYARREKLARDLEAAGLSLEHEEELSLAVMEAETPEALVAWTLAFGMAKLLSGLPSEIRAAWARELSAAAEGLRAPDGSLRLGGTTRIVVARPRARR
ncbi:methyltransferase domain-containing protein [Myxococcota bacterium]|nr:methyltransferase domain-containing protein [Myxococcota bacterium]